MKQIGMLMLMVFAAGCSSSTPSSPSASSTATTELSGSTWTITGSGTPATSVSTGLTYTVKLVTSTCSVTTPLGVFTVAGQVCFIANNNSAAGSIKGPLIPTSSKSLGQGILIGVAADPVPDNSTINMVFVSALGSKFYEFTGTGTISNGKLTGSGACSTASTVSCTGAAATFTGTHQ